LISIQRPTNEVARKYMIRLERTDFEKPQLDQLTGVTNFKPEEF